MTDFNQLAYQCYGSRVAEYVGVMALVQFEHFVDLNLRETNRKIDELESELRSRLRWIAKDDRAAIPFALVAYPDYQSYYGKFGNGLDYSTYQDQANYRGYAGLSGKGIFGNLFDGLI